MVPELTVGPFIAINLSNRKKNAKSDNDTRMVANKTGNWDIPAAARIRGLNGKRVVLFFSTPRNDSKVFVGTVKAHRAVSKTAHKPPRDRYELTATNEWQLVAETPSTFSAFFAGFTMSANPTVVWMDAQNYTPTSDASAGEPGDELPAVPPGVSYMAWVALRANHRVFVKAVVRVWGRKCSLTGISAPSLVHAAHIVPWSVAKGTEQTTAHNGLMLCAHLHALFDGYLISFDDDGSLLLSSRISGEIRDLVLATGHKKLGRKPSAEQARFLKRHRSTVPDSKWTRA
jgi:hypothetical protein